MLEVRRKDIVRHLLINGQKVENEADLQTLIQKLKPGEKFEGVLVQSDTKVVSVVLGERK
jgi:S1-C subfamily serine protease